MSRIGKKPVALPKGVTASVNSANELTVKGPKGELSQAIDRDIKINIEGEQILVERPTDQIRHRALHGLYRSLVANMVTGVTNGFKRELELVGVGYRAAVTGQQIDLALGFHTTSYSICRKRSKLLQLLKKDRTQGSSWSLTISNYWAQ
jgi:large subunit ribosomal protein L6